MSTIPDGNDRTYFVRLIQLIRDANQRCSKASEDWNRANDEFNDWYRRQFPGKLSWKMGSLDPTPKDPLHYVQVKEKNLRMIDAEANWSHWQREVVRLAAALQAEVNVRELLGMAEPASHPTIPTQWKGWTSAER